MMITGSEVIIGMVTNIITSAGTCCGTSMIDEKRCCQHATTYPSYKVGYYFQEKGRKVKFVTLGNKSQNYLPNKNIFFLFWDKQGKK